MATEEAPDNILFDWYETYIGDPQSETDVYLGFGAFFLGILLAVGALVLFFAAVALFGYRGEPGDHYYIWAQVAYATAFLSLPTALIGVTVLLPVERKVVYASSVGGVIVVAGVIAFVSVYPNWAEYSETATLGVLGTYAVGLFVIVASTGTALIAHQLERVKAPAPSEIEAKEDEEPEESYSEEEIRSDIEEAMENVDMTWGGVEKSENKRLQFTSDFESDVDRSAFDNIEAKKTIQDGGVDAQVSGLKQMKGDDVKTATSNRTVDDQTAALQELKKQKEQDEVPDDAPTASSQSLFGKLLSKLKLN